MGFTIKYTVLGGLIYATMAMYLMAFAMAVLATVIKAPEQDTRRTDPARAFAHVLFFAGFALATATYIYRWVNGHNVPMQNLFEAFLTLMVLVWPISMICRRFLRVGGQTADMFIGALICIMPGFFGDAEISPPPPALQTWLFVPHVLTYLITPVIMAKATVQAVGVLIYGNTKPGQDLARRETASHRMVCMAFPLQTAGLILGCIWGKYAWSDFWHWDPKEQWSLATWMSFVAYFHMRYMFGRKYTRLNAAGAIACMVMIVLTLLWVNLSPLFKGIHSYA